MKVRPARETDWPFIFSTWLKQLWYAKHNSTTLPKDTFFRLHHKRIEDLLNVVEVEIACLEDDDDTILGYAVHDKNRYVYMRKAWRRLNIELLFKEVCEIRKLKEIK